MDKPKDKERIYLYFTCIACYCVTFTYSNVPKVFVKFVDVTLQMRSVTNLKCAQHRQYLANTVDISYVVILMLYIRPCKVKYLNVINLVIYQYGMQTWVAAT